MRWQFSALAVLLMMVVAAGSSALDAATKPKSTAKFPSWSEVQNVAKKHFKPADGVWIDAEQTQKFFALLEEQGWRVPNAEGLFPLVPQATEFLSRQLRTARGLAFQKKINGDPRNFDRLEQMTLLRDGQKMVADLMQGPDGNQDMLKYMISPAGVKQLWTMLPGSRGKKFKTSTGRIYTAAQLLERIKPSHDSQSATLSGKKP